MQQAIKQFRLNIERVRVLSSTVSAVNQMTTDAIDLSDVLRAEIVLAVSALDHFVHEYVRLGMLEICSGNRLPTNAYDKFSIPLNAAHLAQATPANYAWLDDTIRERHSWLSFQDPDKIADAIRLISPVKLWEEVEKELGMQAKDVKNTLKLIVDRRNKIAHEADIDPTNPGTRWSITPIITQKVIDDIETIINAIYKVTILGDKRLTNKPSDGYWQS